MSILENEDTILAWAYKLIPIVILMLVTADVWYWLGPVSFKLVGSNPVVDQFAELEKLQTMERILGFLISALPLVAIVMALYHLWQMIDNLRHGHWFTKRNAKLCRSAGIFLFFYMLFSILEDTLLALMLTLDNPPGERSLLVSVTGFDISLLVPALLTVIFSHLIMRACIQRGELESII